MKLHKSLNDTKVAILFPAFCRPEYTALCLKSVEAAQEYTNTIFYMVDDGSEDGTFELLSESSLPKVVIKHDENKGLRSTILEFFKWATKNKIDIIGILGNDSVVFKDWLKKIIKVLTTTDADIISPNYLPSNPAFTQGKEDVDGNGYRKSNGIVGLWYMGIDVISGIEFEDLELYGIKGSMALMWQVEREREPIIGWLEEAQLEDAGHWSGKSKYHIKSKEHAEYSKLVGRGIDWKT